MHNRLSLLSAMQPCRWRSCNGMIVERLPAWTFMCTGHCRTSRAYPLCCHMQTINGSALASLSDQGIADARQVIDGPVEGLVMGVPLSDPSCNTLHCNPPAPDNIPCAARDILYAQSFCNQVIFPLIA